MKEKVFGNPKKNTVDRDIKPADVLLRLFFLSN